LLKSNLFLLNKIKKFLIAPNKLILISMNEWWDDVVEGYRSSKQ
jgi:hypothetical protein